MGSSALLAIIAVCRAVFATKAITLITAVIPTYPKAFDELLTSGQDAKRAVSAQRGQAFEKKIPGAMNKVYLSRDWDCLWAAALVIIEALKQPQ